MLQPSKVVRPGSTVRKAKKEMRLRVKEARKLLRRGRKRVTQTGREEVQERIGQAELALEQNGDPDALQRISDKLGTAVDKHLGAFRKPAWRESFESIGIALLIALMLRAFAVEAFKIPSGSMIPTLAIGDQIFVNKLIYGIRIPFTTVRLVEFNKPERGDVIVFVCPVEPHEDYIKRVIGLPGDEVMVRDGVVFINGEPMPREFVERTQFWDRDITTGRWYPFDAFVYEERIGEESHTVIYDANPSHPSQDYGPVIVPDGHVFMMGDNRDHSFDSRAWGPVPLSNILGRSLFVWLSLGREGIDWSRLGTWIE